MCCVFLRFVNNLSQMASKRVSRRSETTPFVSCHNHIKCKTFIMNLICCLCSFIDLLSFTNSNTKYKGEQQMMNGGRMLFDAKHIWWITCAYSTINLRMCWNEEPEARRFIFEKRKKLTWKGFRLILTESTRQHFLLF